ncbi:MAG: hypothetical protein H6502_05630 [Candidatus Woesearchaeota archaeon]|nr:MAG: hypothetical protein H6502_05630 [Candidatus Woesearchaeota archaeon]
MSELLLAYDPDMSFDEELEQITLPQDEYLEDLFSGKKSIDDYLGTPPSLALENSQMTYRMSIQEANEKIRKIYQELMRPQELYEAQTKRQSSLLRRLLAYVLPKTQEEGEVIESIISEDNVKSLEGLIGEAKGTLNNNRRLILRIEQYVASIEKNMYQIKETAFHLHTYLGGARDLVARLQAVEGPDEKKRKAERIAQDLSKKNHRLERDLDKAGRRFMAYANARERSFRRIRFIAKQLDFLEEVSDIAEIVKNEMVEAQIFSTNVDISMQALSLGAMMEDLKKRTDVIQQKQEETYSIISDIDLSGIYDEGTQVVAQDETEGTRRSERISKALDEMGSFL